MVDKRKRKESKSKREREIEEWKRKGRENRRESVKTKREGMQWKEGQKEVGGGKPGRGWIGEVQNEGEIDE